MRNDARARDKGTSLAKGPAWFIGLAAIALGVTGLLFGSTDFGNDPMSGNVDGTTWLGIEGNGWTWLLFAAGGVLLLLAAPLHWGAKTMALIVGLAFGAASVIALVDGRDVFGTFAANGPTTLVWGAAAVALLVVALLPRVGKKDARRDETRDRDASAVGRAHHPDGHVDERAADDRRTTTEPVASPAERSDRADRVERTGRFERPADPGAVPAGERDRGSDR